MFNFFDLLLIAVLAAGIVQGRKRGMSGEIIALLRWLAILLICAAIYQPLGDMVAQTGLFTQEFSYLLVYLAAALVLFLGFSMVERELRPKLTGSDVFGRGEYYLGMASGLVRATCVLLVALALLNGRSFTPREVKAMDAYQDATFGSQLFPTFYSVQTAVFQKSLTGPWIRQDLGFLLVRPPKDEDIAPTNHAHVAKVSLSGSAH